MFTAVDAEAVLGAAREAKTRGDRLFHEQVEISELRPDLPFPAGHIKNPSVGYLLGDIEALGWRLEHTGYAYVEIGSNASTGALRIGSASMSTAAYGMVFGHFTFRRV